MASNQRNQPCWCGSGKKWKHCHWPTAPAPKPKYLRSEQQVAGIREACRVTATILDALCSAAQPGVTTLDLDRQARELHRQMGARPAPLGYGNPPWRHAICTSINEVVCHGIPDSRPLQEGDILNIDVASEYGGYFGDCSRMVCIGQVSPEDQRLVDTAHASLLAGIRACHVGQPIRVIGDAISDVAEAAGFSVVYQFIGHGVGLKMHESPEIPHHRNRINTPLQVGMTFTIEPMINAGKPDAVIDPSDRWTARTVDGLRSAQWEHTLLMTEGGAEILTHPPSG